VPLYVLLYAYVFVYAYMFVYIWLFLSGTAYQWNNLCRLSSRNWVSGPGYKIHYRFQIRVIDTHLALITDETDILMDDNE